MTIPDAGAMLMPAGAYAANQSFPPLLVYPRQLSTTMLEIHMLTPPTAAATFVLEHAQTQGGTYSALPPITWPAGVSGSRKVPFGVHSSLARLQNNQSVWLRITLQTTSLTGSAWLSPPTDGSFGLGAQPNAIITGVAT